MKKYIIILLTLLSLSASAQDDTIRIKVHGGGISESKVAQMISDSLASLDLSGYTKAQVDSIATVIRSEITSGGVTQAQLDDSTAAIRNDFPTVSGVNQAQLDDTATAIRGAIPDTSNLVKKNTYFPLNLVAPLVPKDSFTARLDSLNLPPLRYSLTNRRIDTDTSLTDKKYVDSSIKINKLFINVRDYGAIGDGATDNTAAIQAAYNAVTDSGSVIYFPAGKYLISDSILISKPCTTIGQGGLMPYYYADSLNAGVRKNAKSQIIQISHDKSGLIVNAEGCQFDNLAVVQQDTVNVPSGYGIKFNHGNSMRMTNVSTSNFYYNTWVVNGLYWSIDKCEFINAYKNDLRLEHQVYPDGEDATISNSYLIGGRYDSLVHLYYSSGGGLKIINTKFQNGVGNKIPEGQIYVNVKNPGMSLLLINNCSFENFKNFGIKIRKDSAAYYTKIVISNNEFNSFAGFANSDIDIKGDVGSLIYGVNITGNVIYITNNDSAAIKLQNVWNGNISGNVIYGGTNKYSLVNCNFIASEVPNDMDVLGNLIVGTENRSILPRLSVLMSPLNNTTFGNISLGGGNWTGTGRYSGSPNGTSIAINEKSGYTGDFINAQINGVSQLQADSSGVSARSFAIARSGARSALTGYFSVARRLNYSDILLSRNLLGVDGSDAYKTPYTNSNGYSGIELKYPNDIVFYAYGGSATAGATVTPVERARITSANGNLLLNTTTDDGINKIQINGSAKATQYRLSALNTAPASATDTGTLGEIRITAGYIYVCTATNTWVRAALATW